MAPEVFINREYKYAADVFSLGIVFYYFFANNFSINKHPFIIGKNDHKDPQKIQNNIKNNARKENPITGVELNHALFSLDRYSASHLINLMLAWEPNERPLAKDLKHHPLFWSPSRKLKFIKTINFVVKAEKSPVSSPQSTNKSLQLKHYQKGTVEKAIESIAYDVFGKDWIDTIDQDENNPNFSQALANHIMKNSHDYVSGAKSKQMCQLLRMIRNYNEHKEDHVFDLGDGITYFTVMFPKLIIELYKTMQPISQMQNDVKNVYSTKRYKQIIVKTCILKLLLYRSLKSFFMPAQRKVAPILNPILQKCVKLPENPDLIEKLVNLGVVLVEENYDGSIKKTTRIRSLEVTTSRLPREFFNRYAVDVARDLLGKTLNFGKFKGVILETEAYRGEDDGASHAFKGPNKKCAIIYGEPGYSYVYSIRAYHCLGIVVEEIGQPGAILIRNVKFSDGTHINGPGRLCRHLKITKIQNGINLAVDPKFYISDDGVKVESYKATKRIGISKSVENMWRFVIV
uniref:DNA-3-methyladenine glycosylase II n=1 Tax=Acrobeloides nanus TaxID=290746 RepID=A0A914EJV0_9BILA